MSKLNSLLTPWRLTWYPRAFLFALVIAFLLSVFVGNGASTLTGRLGGDYPAFYGAGRIVAQGDGNNLYNSATQAEVQKGFYPGETNVFMPFPYPPFVAIAYCPLALISYRLSYAIHTILMVGALFLSIFLIASTDARLRQYYLFFACIALSFYPMLRAIFGGQNTPMTLLLIVLSWRAALAKKDFLAGILLGLLLFKPQFGILLIGLYVMSGRWSVGLGSMCTAIALYGIGALLSGPTWITSWYQYTVWLSQADAAINYDKAVSWLGLSQALIGWKNQLALFIGWAMSAVTAIAVTLVWVLGRRKADLTTQLAVTLPALTLIPPHVNYYDIGLVIFTAIVMIGRPVTGAWLPLYFMWILGFSQPLSGLMGVSPLSLVVVSTLIWSLFVLSKPANSRAPLVKALPLSPSNG